MALASTTVTTLETEYASLTSRIAELIASPQPSYSENGRSVSKTELLNSLYEQRRKLLADIQAAGGPFTTYG